MVGVRMTRVAAAAVICDQAGAVPRMISAQISHDKNTHTIAFVCKSYASAWILLTVPLLAVRIPRNTNDSGPTRLHVH